MPIASLNFCYVVLLLVAATCQASKKNLRLLMSTMSTDILDLARELEDAYEHRCESATLVSCGKSNYHDCKSEFEQATCIQGELYDIPECTAVESCGSLYSFVNSNIRLPPEIDDDDFYIADTGKNLIESICYSRLSEQWMINKHIQDLDFWESYDVDSPTMFYGSEYGMFRIYPGRQLKVCGEFDPRVRPWYVAASSGPKDIVLVLDISYSMDLRSRIRIMKEAASAVVNTLALGDFVSVIVFSDKAQKLDTSSSYLMRATAETKSKLVDLIEGLVVDGKTNFYAAFDLAFDILISSVDQEKTSNCRSAILFLTDGEMSIGNGAKTAEDVLSLIDQKRAAFVTESGGREPPVIFTYSLGQDADDDLPKQIACQTGGVWSKIEDGDDLSSSMSSYYKYFAFGLGDGKNQDFVAWVEPYNFASGGILGTTVSAPVYDRKVNPPFLVGVVGMNIVMAAMDKALGENAGENTVLDELVERSVAVCPKLNLTECQIQMLRKVGQGVNKQFDPLCSGQCTNLSQIEGDPCDQTDLPNDVLANRFNEGRSFEERMCCSRGEERSAGSVPYEEILKDQCVARTAANSSGKGRTSNKKRMIAIVELTVAGVLALFYF